MTDTERTDAELFHPGYGRGGVPWYLLIGYLAFLCFFTWYALEFQLPDFLEKQAAGEETTEIGDEG
jgi:hypothetical protein